MIFLLTFLVILLIAGISIYIEESEEKRSIREQQERKISRIKDNIKDEFDYLEKASQWQYGEIIPGLERYADRMKKILSDESILKNLKPYDEFYRTNIKKNSTLHGTFKIVIDKNLVPKFSPDRGSYDKQERDIELEACMNINELEEFIKKCKRLVIDKEIEDHRKKKVEDKLK